MSYLQQKRDCVPASLDLLPCCGVGGSSHLLLLTLLGPPQIGKLISGGLVHMGPCAQVTSGGAFLPLFSEPLVTCAL